jgi:hypothetical protein
MDGSPEHSVAIIPILLGYSMCSDSGGVLEEHTNKAGSSANLSLSKASAMET